jgi:hypothetical protein
MRQSHNTQAQSTMSHCRLTSPKAECSRIRSKVSFDWLPSYIKDTREVHEIFKMARYFPDSLVLYSKQLTFQESFLFLIWATRKKSFLNFDRHASALQRYITLLSFLSLILQLVLPYYLPQFLYFKHTYNVISILIFLIP